tara:strand:+ start:482 stop:712 length:231 start_codon:yes stop_codon:yes gene_type:complete
MTEQTNHQSHLESAVEQQKQILTEINDLQTQINTKKEIVLKVQGVIEYLQQVIPPAPTDSATVTEEPVTEEPVTEE